MNESEFNDLVDEIFIQIEDSIENACDKTGADIDYDTASNILTLSFTNGTKIIINRQAPLQQIWLAAKKGGFHFDFDLTSQKWICNGQELFSSLSKYCSDQAEQNIKLEIPA